MIESELSNKLNAEATSFGMRNEDAVEASSIDDGMIQMNLIKKRPREQATDDDAPSNKITSNTIRRSVPYVETFDQFKSEFEDSCIKGIMSENSVSRTRSSIVSYEENAGEGGDLDTDKDLQKSNSSSQQQRVALPSVDKIVERWTCDFCKDCSFETFDEACRHEDQCKLRIGAKKATDEKLNGAAGALTSLARCAASSACNNQFSERKENEMVMQRHPPINMIPEGGDAALLSDYNNLLVRNIEFFLPSENQLNYTIQYDSKSDGGMADHRLGLRCIHCANNPEPITAATFFPTAISSIASGLGTIGNRHFGWGKCPYVQPGVVEQMIETKKTSGQQTRTDGRIGLDAYCKNIAKQNNIFENDGDGICWIKGSHLNDNQPFSLPQKSLDRSTNRPYSFSCNEAIKSSSNSPRDVDRNDVASVLVGMKHITNNGGKSGASFVPSDVEHFWECRGCKSLPFNYRSKGSVVFSARSPSLEMIESHLEHCSGDKALAIPRNAVIEPFYGENIPPIRVKWESMQADTKPSEKIEDKARSDSFEVKSGVDDEPLAFPDDKQYTTDFAFYTVLQLKKCYLTKSGGSRGACPVGYPGLACGHCAGKLNERRFFYTSAGHLRNSFAHIPAHMVECSACPTDVKNRLEELKEIRKRQKLQIKPGHHKIFIDRVWNRLHGQSTDESDSSSGGMSRRECSSIATQSEISSVEGRDRKNVSVDKQTLSSKNHAPSTVLAKDSDRSSTTDLTFFTLLQVQPYDILGQSDDIWSHEIGFPGLVCRHCIDNSNGRKFFTTSPEYLGGLLTTISTHLLMCKQCPDLVKTLVVDYQNTHEEQLLHINKGEHDEFMKRVWNKLLNFKDKKESSMAAKTEAKNEVIQYAPVDRNTPLIHAADASLVTPFTFYTMQQVRPCSLKNSGNGSRSAFDSGFPGLECIHCAGRPNARKFFYRTADILCANYAHIPNHLMGCSKVPEEVKRALLERKEMHGAQKVKLDRGSQRVFFHKVWERLHMNSTIVVKNEHEGES